MVKKHKPDACVLLDLLHRPHHSFDVGLAQTKPVVLHLCKLSKRILVVRDEVPPDFTIFPNLFRVDPRKRPWSTSFQVCKFVLKVARVSRQWREVGGDVEIDLLELDMLLGEGSCNLCRFFCRWKSIRGGSLQVVCSSILQIDCKALGLMCLTRLEAESAVVVVTLLVDAGIPWWVQFDFIIIVALEKHFDESDWEKTNLRTHLQLSGSASSVTSTR